MSFAFLFVIFIHLAVNSITEVFAIYAVKGSTGELVCPYTSTSSLRWAFTSTTASVYTTYTINDRISPILPSELVQRLSVTGNHTLGQYHLKISNIKKSDQGIYQCTDTSTVQSNTQELIVIVGPTNINIENVTPDNKIPGIEGQDISIKCTSVGGQPPPDIKLVILGTTYTGNQSRQHTFKPVRANDGSNVTCLAGYEEIKSYSLFTSAKIHLMLIPIITPFTHDSLSTEETKSFAVSCQSTGSRPAANMYWLLGQLQNNVTSNSTSQSNQESTTEKYTVISNIKYRVDRRYSGQKLICRASNVAGYVDTSLTLNVKYAPGITVENNTFSHSESSRQIHSTLDSNPSVNTCKWQQRSKYGKHIRDFSDKNQILTLPTVSVVQRYQDAGEYVCTAENGVIGINGQLKQTGSGYVISNAPPVITADNNSTQYGKFSRSTELKVTVYSIPKYSGIIWYIGNTQLVSNKYAIKEEPAIVKDLFHGVEVQLDGYRVTLTISDLQEADFTNYTLRLYYGSMYVQYEVTLESTSAPETPSSFNITSSSETSITVQWISGYDGGQKQTFYVQYRTSGTNRWMLQEMNTISQLDIHNFYTLPGLQEKTTYELRMYAQNVFNQSKKTDTATTTTLQSVIKEAQTSFNAMTGAVAGVVAVLLIVCAIIISIFVFKKRKGMKKTKKDTGLNENSSFQNVQNGDEYEEVFSKSDTQQKQTSKTYESLGTKIAADVYDELDHRKGLPSSKPSVDHYEALSAKDKPNIYEKLENQQDTQQKQTSKTYESLGTKIAADVYDELDHRKGLPSTESSVDHYEGLSAKDKPNIYEKLENQQGQTEKVYVNEAF